MAGKKQIKPSEYQERMLITLVKLWEAAESADLRVKGASGTWLAFQSGILSLGKAGPEDYSRDEKQEIWVAVKALEDRDLVSTLGSTMGFDYSGIKPTHKGIEHAHRLMRSWYRKAWDAVKGDVRTVVIAVITAIIITIVTTLILKAIGWL